MTRYERAIDRNLAEVERALSNLSAMRAFERVKGISANELKVLYYALFNDYIAHCIKVLDENSQSATFWYVFKTNEAPLRRFAKRNDIDFDFLRRMSEKLKRVRDLTHFHIDREAVFNPRQVWVDASIKGNDLSRAINYVWALLNIARVGLGKEPMERPQLNEEALSRAAKLLEESEEAVT